MVEMELISWPYLSYHFVVCLSGHIESDSPLYAYRFRTCVVIDVYKHTKFCLCVNFT